MKNLIVIIACVCFSAAFSFAQPGCNNLIEEATDFYNSGRYDDCIRTLENGLKTCSFSKSKKEKAYILLINSNIEKDSMPSVDRYFKLLLLNNPAFKVNDYDGIDDFKGNFENYYVLPKLSLGARFYYGSPTINVDSNYYVMPEVTPKSSYTAEPLINMNLTLDYRINRRWALLSEIGYFGINYKYETQNSYWRINFSEKLSYLQFDLGTKVFFNTYKRLNVFVLAGVSNHLLMSGKLNMTTIERFPDYLYSNDPNNYVEDTATLENYNSKKLRNFYVPYIIAGAGLQYTFGRFAYGADFRLYQHLRNINNTKQRIDDTLINNNSYMDSNFNMFRWDVSVSVNYLFNKVKSKKLRQD